MQTPRRAREGFDLIGRLGIAVLVMSAAAGAAAAQTYPSKPIRFIAAFPAGGPSDIVSRALTKRMAELLKSMARIDAVHVPYKGAIPALADLVGGHVDFYVGGISGVLPQVTAGRVRALGVTGSRRSSQLPDVPTIAEAGLPGYEVVTWFGVVARADTPQDITR
jgi:tripartite-type tricarboxylate transporter receptor subunit TctC